MGDLNIAPLPQDVWDHKKMLKIVSHTQVEVEHFNDVMAAGDWIDVTRKDIPEELLYSWWSYRGKTTSYTTTLLEYPYGSHRSNHPQPSHH